MYTRTYAYLITKYEFMRPLDFSSNRRFRRRRRPVFAIRAGCVNIIWEKTTVSAISDRQFQKVYVPCGATQDVGKQVKTSELILSKLSYAGLTMRLSLCVVRLPVAYTEHACAQESSRAASGNQPDVTLSQDYEYRTPFNPWT